jgi:hypothetical protein
LTLGLSLAAAFCAGLLVVTLARGDEDLSRGFVSPPDAAKPWAYWWWLNGNVSRQGITRDLEEMKRQGIQGVLIFNAGGAAGPCPQGPPFMSPQWRELFRHALRELDRLGMEASMNLCDGWDAGGPWISASEANKKLVYSEISLDGPGKVSRALPAPPAVDGFHRDVAVVALRESPSRPVAPALVTASSSWSGYCDEWNWPPEDATDGDPETSWRPHQSRPSSPETPAWLQWEYHEPLPASKLCLTATSAGAQPRCELQASDDGRQFRSVARFELESGRSQDVGFPETRARFFRLALAEAGSTSELEGCWWIWYPEGNPAASAAPGAVYFRKEILLAEGKELRSAVLKVTADNSFILQVNGQAASEGVAGTADFRSVKTIDVRSYLKPGRNLLAVAASNASDQPNPAGLIAKLEVKFADGGQMSFGTDETWQASRDGGAAAGQAAGAGDGRGWLPAMKAAPYGGGPWGRVGAPAADLQVAEAWLLRKGDEPPRRRGIKWWAFKSGNRSFWDWPRQGPAVLLDEYADDDGARDCRGDEVLDLTARMDAAGRLDWEAPAGRWTVLRFGYTLEGQRTRCGTTVVGYESDMLDARGIERHFQSTAEPLLADAAAVSARSLEYLHIDSYELGADVRGQQPTWSEAFRREFKARRGYDLLPYLPAMARRIVDGRERTGRFFWDFRRTIGDLMAERFFRRFGELAHARGMKVHCETGYGTYPYPHIDGLQCAGSSDIPMGEFWHGTDIMSQFNHFGNVIRSVASAAHVYGKSVVQAEAFTSWNHWLESPFSLKSVGDEAFCDGLNRMVFHQYTHQPELEMKPGWQYGAGTHFDRNITWWEQSRAFFQYLARCQHLLQQGMFVADVAYVHGEGTTIFVPSKEHRRPELPAGYDCDSVNAEVLSNRLSVKDGRLCLPDGMSYRLLVLPEARVLSPGILRKVKDLIQAGACVTGPRPVRAPGLSGYPRCDEELRELADDLWGKSPAAAGDRRIGAGRLSWGKALSEVLASMGVPPDAELERVGAPAALRFIHRSIGGADAYFVSNRSNESLAVEATFRVAGRRPELWDPVTGEIRELPEWREEGGRVTVPLELAPSQSFFVVFRQKRPGGGTQPPAGERNFPEICEVAELGGPWDVSYDPRWGGPEKAVFEKLEDWSKRPEEGIRHYSGTATYRKAFDLPARAGAPASRGERLYLDLGVVKEVAQVRLNGKDLGVVWCAPWRADITAAVKPSGNQLEIDVVNLWPNRLIGDGGLPPEKRLGKTNVGFSAASPLLPSGLLGPVTIRKTLGSAPQERHCTRTGTR